MPAATAKPIVPLGHEQHRAIHDELARARELADELGVKVTDVLTQQLVQYRAALRETREERDELRAQLYGRFGA